MSQRLHTNQRAEGRNLLQENDWFFFSVNLRETHEDDRLAMIGLLARIIKNQDKRIDNAVREFKRLAAKPETHQKGTPSP